MLSKKVEADWEHVKLMEVVKSTEFLDLVIVKTQVCQLRQGVQSLNFLNEVETEIQPLQVDQVVNVLNLADDIIIQLQFRQFFHAL